MVFFNSFVLFFFIELLCSETSEASKNSPVVEIQSGKIRGTIETGVTGEKYLAYKGIPYAKPPLGDLRFEVSNSCSHHFLIEVIYTYSVSVSKQVCIGIEFSKRPRNCFEFFEF